MPFFFLIRFCTGDLSTDSPGFPDRPEWEKDWSAATGVRMFSAYKEVEGHEPDFTNHAKVCRACGVGNPCLFPESDRSPEVAQRGYATDNPLVFQAKLLRFTA